MFSRSLCAATAGVALFMAGCHQLQSDYNDFLTSRSNASEAFWAWADVHKDYEGQVFYIYDFGDGFKAGYAQILGGGDACPPTLPPEKYWYVKYQNPAGRERIDAWFSGHEAGVSTALQDGVQGGNKLPMSPYRRAQLQGMNGCPTCPAPAHAAPAYDYDSVPPMPRPDAAPGEIPVEPLAPLTQADAELEEYEAPEVVESEWVRTSYHAADAAAEQE